MNSHKQIVSTVNTDWQEQQLEMEAELLPVLMEKLLKAEFDF